MQEEKIKNRKPKARELRKNVKQEEQFIVSFFIFYFLSFEFRLGAENPRRNRRTNPCIIIARKPLYLSVSVLFGFYSGDIAFDFDFLQRKRTSNIPFCNICRPPRAIARASKMRLNVKPNASLTPFQRTPSLISVQANIKTKSVTTRVADPV